MKRGFSASTVFLVALLLTVLFMVGKYVNPPTKGGHDDHDSHSEDTPKPTPPRNSPSPPGMDPKSHMPPQSSGGRMDPGKMHELVPSKPPVRTPPKAGAPPKSDEMDAAYFQNHNMGAAATKPDVK